MRSFFVLLKLDISKLFIPKSERISNKKTENLIKQIKHSVLLYIASCLAVNHPP
ncbi:hypothetical protein D920_02632 [Enterococcus faecalis 13-SD-W-01]|nr:hypothetical protein D920_02632 [Enterococcus faecalis 13-SD-W-01]